MYSRVRHARFLETAGDRVKPLTDVLLDLFGRGALHPNGFTIRVLRVFGNGMRVRLHRWPPSAARLDTPHDHRSWFVSVPIWGTFIERRFREESRASADYVVLRCHSTSGNGNPITSRERRTGLIEESVSMRLPLVPYYCPADVIHSFVPMGDGFAASIVFFGPNKKTPRAFVSEADDPRFDS